MHNIFKKTTPILALSSMLVLATCGDPNLIPPESLDAPTKFAVINDVCFNISDDSQHLVEFADCESSNLKGGLALIVNEQSDRVSMLQMASSPSFIDTDVTSPGVSHLKVGRLPVDIAIAPKGAAAYVLNQLDRTISIIDTSEIRAGKAPHVLDQNITIGGVPLELETHPISGDIFVAYDAPSSLDIFESWTSCNDDLCKISPNDNKTTLKLPGTVSDFQISENGKFALIAYRDLDILSRLSFDGECEDPTQSAPCIEASISVTYGCSDGIDNDGDGKIDSQDAQCFGPKGSESPAGNGRDAKGPCSDGIDNDGDSLTDRDDPECVISQGASEEKSTFENLPKTPCNDGVDNDDDGKTDFPADPSCYGPYGRTEGTIPQRGVDAISIDSLGVFAYLVDRIHNEVKVVNLQKNQLIDSPRSAIPAFSSFTRNLGIGVTSTPLDVSAVVFRRVEKESVSYTFGAWVSSDSSLLQYVDAFNIDCDLQTEDLSTGYIQNISAEEKECLKMPTFPLASLDQRIVANDPMLPKSCKDKDADLDFCQRTFVNGDRTFVINPRLSQADDFISPGRAVGTRSCEQPPAIVEAMKQFTLKNPNTPQQFKCDSVLMPQPISLGFLNSDTNPSEIASFDRATIIKRKTVSVDGDISETTFDQSLSSENWTVTFEGVLPRTSRKDGLLDEEANNDQINITSGLNPCNAGVKVGDYLTILTESTCDEFKDEAKNFLTFEVTSFNSSEVSLKVVKNEGTHFATALPDRSCFDTAIEFEIRPFNEWTVVGDESGFSSENTSKFGECVPIYSSQTRRRGRVRTGQTFEGPYLSFDLYHGFGGKDAILPVQGLSFSFTIERNFKPLRYQTLGTFPSTLRVLPNMRKGATYLVSTDLENDFIYLLNLENLNEKASRLR